MKASLTIILCLLSLSIQSCKPKGSESGISTDPLAIANEMEEVLTAGMMDHWYPLCIDEIYGGFLSSFDQEWNPKENQLKFLVMQSRHIWALAQMARIYPENNTYITGSEHGYKFLRDFMWDPVHGGFFALTSREGKVIAEGPGEVTKNAYGNAFAIFGLSAYYEISGDTAALELAIKAFRWLDKHGHDPVHGGYFQFLKPDGTAMKDGHQGTPPKDQNSSIHILECLTGLYSSWPDAELKSRLSEMLILIRDTITTDKGYMNLFFRPDWSPVYYTDTEFGGGQNKHLLDHISFGHDIETAFLLMEASEVIGEEDDAQTLQASKKMADHCISKGWDPETGATYEAGYYFGDSEDITILEHSTQWWAATETFHTLLLLSELYPNDTLAYYEKFTLTWDYCKSYLIDHENGGWYRVGINVQPWETSGDKGSIWKGNYHNARSLINCIQMLKSVNITRD